MTVGTTTVKVHINCGSPTSPGLDVPKKEGPILVCFSVGYEGDPKKIQEFCVEGFGYDDPKEGGDTAEDMGPRAEAAASGTTAGKSGVKPTVKVTDPNQDFEVTFYGATHVDAYSNYGKIQLSAVYIPPPPPPPPKKGPTTPSGGTKEDPNPPGLGLKPPEVLPPPLPPMKGTGDKLPKRPKKGGGSEPWPKGTPDGRRKWQSWLDKILVTMRDPGPQRNLVSRYPAGEPESRGGIGELIVGWYTDAAAEVGRVPWEVIRVPFEYKYTTVVDQLLEMAIRLDAAGIDVDFQGTTIIATRVRVLGRAPDIFGIDTGRDTTNSFGPFPWHWMLLTGRWMQPAHRVAEFPLRSFTGSLRRPEFGAWLDALGETTDVIRSQTQVPRHVPTNLSAGFTSAADDRRSHECPTCRDASPNIEPR